MSRLDEPAVLTWVDDRKWQVWFKSHTRLLRDGTFFTVHYWRKLVPSECPREVDTG